MVSMAKNAGYFIFILFKYNVLFCIPLENKQIKIFIRWYSRQAKGYKKLNCIDESDRYISSDRSTGVKAGQMGG